MAIRNISIGGASNWTSGELGLKSTDLNDTFDALISKTKEMSTFWLNSFFYTKYDDFSTYVNSASISTTLWNYSYSGTGTGTFLCSTSSIQSGGVLAEGVLSMSAGSGAPGYTGLLSATSNILTSNKHLYFKVTGATGGSNNGVNQISVDNGTTLHTLPVLGTYPFPVLVQALGSSSYKVFIGSKTVQTGNITTLRIKLIVNLGSATNNPASSTLYISDVYTSGSSIT